MEITLGKIVSYGVGIPLVLASIVLTILSPLGLIPLIFGLLILPPIRRQLSKRVGVDFSRGAAAGIGTLGVIAAIVVLLVAALSGGGGGSAQPGSDVSNVSISAVDSSPEESLTALNVEWNSRAQSAVDPDPDDISSYSSNEGQKYVVFRLQIENVGNESVDLTPRLFRLRSEGTEYDHQTLFGSGNSLSGVTLNSGGEYSGWVAFSVPEDLVEAELIVYQDAVISNEITVTFNHNPSMPIEMDD